MAMKIQRLCFRGIGTGILGSKNSEHVYEAMEVEPPNDDVLVQWFR